jgi:hypothetical protein
MCLSIGISPRVNTYATLPSKIKIARSKTKQNCKTSSKIQRQQHQQRSTSARLPQLLKFTTSNTKQFRETSFKSGSSKLNTNSKVESWKPQFFRETEFKFGSWKLFLWGFLQIWHVSDITVTIRFADVGCTLSKSIAMYCACHKRMRPGHTKCCTCHASSSWQT